MSAKNDGGPAFPGEAPGTRKFWHGIDPEGPPVPLPGDTHAGMSLRDYFAAKAMTGLVGKYELGSPLRHSAEERLAALAHVSYAIADAMIAERSKP